MPNTPTSTLEPPRIACFLLAVVVAIGAAGAGCAQVSPYEGRNATVFTNVNVLPMDSERVLAEQTVVVVDGRIADMGAASEIAVPSDSTVIVGTGQYLMPGLTEMHGHLPSSFLARDDIPLEEITEIVLFLYVANGVTLVRGMQGDESHLELRDRIEAQDLLGPHLLVSAPMLHGRQVTDPDQAAELVRGYAARGFDHLKVHEELSLDVYDAIAATANEVGLRFSGHVSNKVGLQHALDAGQATIDHLDNYVETLVADATPEELQGTLTPVQLIDRVDESGIAAMVEATRAAGAAVVPTLVLWETFMGEASGDEPTMLRPEVRYMPPYEIDRWTEGCESAPRDRQSRAGRSRHRSATATPEGAPRRRRCGAAGNRLATAVQCPWVLDASRNAHDGRCRPDALRRARFGHARSRGSYGKGGDSGTVAIGAVADLILLASNPLDDLAALDRPRGVMVGGRWLDRQAIDTRLAEIQDRFAALSN